MPPRSLARTSFLSLSRSSRTASTTCWARADSPHSCRRLAASRELSRSAARNQRKRASKSGSSSTASPFWTGHVFRKSKAKWLPRKRNPSFQSEFRSGFDTDIAVPPALNYNTDNESIYRLAHLMLWIVEGGLDGSLFDASKSHRRF